MNCGKTIFAQLMDFLLIYEFHQCVQRYHGYYKMKSFSCWDQFLCMAFAQLTYQESLRDIETCLRSAQRIFLLLAGCSQVIVTDTKVPRMTNHPFPLFGIPRVSFPKVLFFDNSNIPATLLRLRSKQAKFV